MISAVGQNLKFAARQLRRNPGFTATVIFTLALSIGANTAIFSIVNALLLKSLPYSHPERLGTIYTRATGEHGFDERHALDGTQWELLRDEVPSLVAAIAGGTNGVNLQAGARIEYVQQGRVSAHYFDVLAISPLMGRAFTEAEDRPRGPNVVMLSYALWHGLFGGDPAILGQSILLKGAPFTVIGILPQTATTTSNADLYTTRQASRSGEGGGTNFEVITRLRDGATWQQADAEINRAWSSRIGRYEQRNPGSKISFYSVPLQKGATAQLRPQVLTLMLSAGFILLIACANLAGLTLVRVLRRAPEVATRLALGASLWQVQKQLWMENLLLALAGGLAGVTVGFAALRGLLVLLPANFLPVAGVSLDLRVLAFAFLLSLATSIFFGALPALAARDLDLRSAIASRAAAGGDRMRVRQVLIMGEVALTVVLLAGAGLLIRTLIHLETLPPGFDANGVMTAKASLDDARYHDPVALQTLYRESIDAMRHIPGVEQAAVGLTLPYERTLNDNVTLDSGRQVGTDEVYVTPGYFETLRVPVLTGRPFAESDSRDGQSVVIVNRSFVHKFFQGANPVGRFLDHKLIVGVVEDVPISSGLNPTAPLQGEETIYVPAAQVDGRSLAALHVWFQPSWVVRTTRPLEGLTAQMQRALASADPNLPFSGFYDMRDLMVSTLAMQRVEVALLSALAALALLLSAVGIFALVANTVTQKTREIGIRIALGSSVRHAMVHIGTPAARAALFGLAAGLLLSAGALRAMRSVLYGVGVYDGPTIGIVVLTLAVVTLLATTVPTLRIAAIDPARTLRDE
jgi:predicted permease